MQSDSLPKSGSYPAARHALRATLARSGMSVAAGLLAAAVLAGAGIAALAAAIALFAVHASRWICRTVSLLLPAQAAASLSVRPVRVQSGRVRYWTRDGGAGP
jgi:hypothetical protein